MNNNTSECRFFLFGILIVLFVFLLWPGVVMSLADITAPVESKLDGVARNQYDIYSQIYTCLGSLFAGMAFLGTYLLIRSSNAQKKQLEEQITHQKVQARTEVYIQMIESLHRHKSQISPSFATDKVLEVFGEAADFVSNVKAYGAQLIRGGDIEQATKQHEMRFFEIRKHWREVASLFMNVSKLIIQDKVLKDEERNMLCIYLRSAFSPNDVKAMAIFFSTIKFDLYSYPLLKKIFTTVECSSFEDYAKGVIKAFTGDPYCEAVIQEHLNEIYSKLENILHLQISHPTSEDAVVSW